jgi:predicted membrane-bound mannosyltransferase
VAAHSDRLFAFALVAQTAFAGALALVHIGEKPFWQDEVASVSVAHRSLAGIFDVLGDTDANMRL